MCGIGGVWDPGGRMSEQAREVAVAGMSEAMARRGPDLSRMWAGHDGIVLGHRRLSVVELSEAGAQPMTSRSGRWTIVFNGEIYNHRSLHSRLGAHPFRGGSDTEVLVELIDLLGVERTLQLLDGMFAFAAWDASRRELHLARDRFGEKPLVFCRRNGVVSFASDLRALGQPGLGAFEVDPEAVHRFLEFRMIPAPLTIYRDVRKVMPGAITTFDAAGRRTDVRYFDPWVEAERLGGDPILESPRAIADRVERVLGDTIEAQLCADVPVGVFLSGGIDSTLVTALAQSRSSHPVRTFTIGLDEAGFDESAWARQVAAHLGTEHTELIVKPPEAMAAIERVIAAYDEPFADSSQLPTLLVSELARRSVTVALGGDGGDEMFGGYNRHVWLPKVWSRLDRVPLRARRVAGRVVGGVSPRMLARAAGFVPGLRDQRILEIKLAKLTRMTDAASLMELRRRAVGHWLSPGGITGLDLPPWLPPGWNPRLGVQEALLVADLAEYLPDEILTKVDRASMYPSLEVRAPFLGRDVFELAYRIPIGQRIRDGVTKAPLRDVLARHVPREMWERPKAGFGIPLGLWMAGPLRTWVDEHLHSPTLTGMGLDMRPVMAAWAEAQRAPNTDQPYLVWDLVMLAAWATSIGL